MLNNSLPEPAHASRCLRERFPEVMRGHRTQILGVQGISIGAGGWLTFTNMISLYIQIGECVWGGRHSVVTRDVPPFSVETGNPAIAIKMCNPPDPSVELDSIRRRLPRTIAGPKRGGVPVEGGLSSDTREPPSFCSGWS
ncbi:hypothetical protein D3C87_1311450 [compost metagenome]